MKKTITNIQYVLRESVYTANGLGEGWGNADDNLKGLYKRVIFVERSDLLSSKMTGFYKVLLSKK